MGSIAERFRSATSKDKERAGIQNSKSKPLTPKPPIHPREEQAVFRTLDGIDRERYIVVHYALTPKRDLTLAKAAARVAIITTQTLSQMPYEKLECRLEHAGVVLSVQNNGQVIIGYPIEHCTLKEGMLQLISLLVSGGEYDFCNNFWVEQIELPARFLRNYAGPKFGIEGIRDKFQVRSRAFIGATIKSRYCTSLSEIESQCRSCLLGGADYIADDGLLIDPEGELAFSSRISALTKVAREASKSTGENKWYVANIGASPKQAKEYLKIAENEGAGAARVNGFLMGFPTLADIASETSLPVICTNIGVGLLTRVNPQRYQTSTGISESVISKLSRLAGADAVHLGSINAGCFVQASWDPAIINLQAPLHQVRPAFVVAAGNITVANIWDNIASFGCDLMIEADEGILGYPWGSFEGAKVFRRFAEDLLFPLDENEANERILEMAQEDTRLSQALVYYDYKPRGGSSQHE